MKWIFSVSSCPDVLSDDGFATKRHCVRSNREKKNIYLPSVYIISVLCLDLRHFKFCDRVFIQSTDFYDDILVSLVPDKHGLENGVLLFHQTKQT